MALTTQAKEKVAVEVVASAVEAVASAVLITAVMALAAADMTAVHPATVDMTVAVIAHEEAKEWPVTELIATSAGP